MASPVACASPARTASPKAVAASIAHQPYAGIAFQQLPDAGRSSIGAAVIHYDDFKRNLRTGQGHGDAGHRVSDGPLLVARRNDYR
jgi:hypothetical protein